MKIRWVGVELFQANGKTDKHEAFSFFAVLLFQTD